MHGLTLKLLRPPISQARRFLDGREASNPSHYRQAAAGTFEGRRQSDSQRSEAAHHGLIPSGSFSMFLQCDRARPNRCVVFDGPSNRVPHSPECALDSFAHSLRTVTKPLHVAGDLFE